MIFLPYFFSIMYLIVKVTDRLYYFFLRFKYDYCFVLLQFILVFFHIYYKLLVLFAQIIG